MGGGLKQDNAETLSLASPLWRVLAKESVSAARTFRICSSFVKMCIFCGRTNEGGNFVPNSLAVRIDG